MGNSPSKKSQPSSNGNSNNKVKKPIETVNTPITTTTTATSTNTNNNTNNTTNINTNSTTKVQPSNNSGGNTTNTNNSSGTTQTSVNNFNNKVSISNSKEDKSKRLEDFYEKYRDEDNPSVIGPDGITKLCKDLNVEPEDIVVLVLAWHLGAKQMGFFSKTEFIGGLSKLNIDSLQKLQSHLPNFKKDLDDHNNFKDIYRFAFIYSKENENTKTIDLESACSMLQLILGTRYPHTEKLQEFLLQQKAYKVLNMDQWLSILEFCKAIKEDVSNYDENGAWPVLLDNYVEWRHETATPAK